MRSTLRIPGLALALSTLMLCEAPAGQERGGDAAGPRTRVSLVDGRWHLNGMVTHLDSPAEGLLMNVRMVNATFEDRKRPDFDAEANTDEFLARIPEYMEQGVLAFTLCLQGGMRGYEGAVNSAFSPDGSLDDVYLKRVRRVIEACDRHGAVVILGCYYQRQDQILKDEDAVRAGVANAAKWIEESGFTNVVLEVANEFGHRGFDHPLLKTADGQVELIRLAKQTAPELLVSTSGGGSGRLPESVAQASDFLLIHFNNTPVDEIPSRIAALKRFNKAIVCNEDDKDGATAARAAQLSVENGASWGLMLQTLNQHLPFEFKGAADDPVVYAKLKELTSPGAGRDRSQSRAAPQDYFPPPDSDGGWRTLKTAEEIRRVAGLDVRKLDEAFAVAEASTKNGGLLVVRRGWLVYERYFGLAHREATPNLASCGKSFTSIAVGILMAERPDLFPDGLDQKVFTPAYFPPEAFPLCDPARAEIRLGQLLAFSAGIRGNNPGLVHGKEVTLDPPGPDGWQALVDDVVLGRRDIESGGRQTSAATLWCEPGDGYSYATASAHLASMIVRHVSGMELEEYVRKHLAEPLGWGRFGWGYKHAKQVEHTPGGGGIAVRATDMLRFGYLLLREGRWGDSHVVPAEYVRHCGRRSPYNPHSPYSLQFDVNTDGYIAEYPRDAFWKSGSGGHMLFVVPSLDLVVWKLAGRDGQYQQNDTGLALDPEIARTGLESRREWKATIELREGQRRVLEQVIEGITDGRP